MFIHAALKRILIHVQDLSSDGRKWPHPGHYLMHMKICSSIFACDFLIIYFPRLFFCIPLLSKYDFFVSLATWVYFHQFGYWSWKRVQWSVEAQDLFYRCIEYKRLESTVSPKHVEHIQIFIQRVIFHLGPCSHNSVFMNFFSFLYHLMKIFPFFKVCHLQEVFSDHVHFDSMYASFVFLFTSRAT